jgi:hypothetical protein
VVKLSLEKLGDYLSNLHGTRVKIINVGELGKAPRSNLKSFMELKGFGYGRPYLIEYQIKNQKKSAVLETMRKDSFGHDYPSDRAQNLLLAHLSYNKFHKHVKSLDVGAFTREGLMKSVGDYTEFFILLKKVEGREYYWDLEELASKGSLTATDRARCKALSNYLVDTHRKKWKDPRLYRRRIRELFGHGECIMGLVDNYPQKTSFVTPEELHNIEKKCLEWRWMLRDKEQRLCHVHGDFHPWNILFRKRNDFTVLDQSRGEWGEAADDVASMSINYLFYSLQTYGELKDPFKELFYTFVNNYLEQTSDYDLLKVIQPFYAWRGLVLANPIWYPTLNLKVRRMILNFINNCLDLGEIDLKKINSYLK